MSKRCPSENLQLMILNDGGVVRGKETTLNYGEKDIPRKVAIVFPTFMKG